MKLGIPIVFILALAFYLALTDRHPLYTRGESREAIVAQAMIDSSEYILPLRNGEDIPSKPPLYHWLVAGTSLVSGDVDEFTVRFPSILAGALGAAVFFLFALREGGLLVAVTSFLVLLSSFEWMRGASHGRVDAVFATMFSVACLLLFELITKLNSSPKSVSVTNGIAASLALVLAGLAKGPAGIVLPVVIVVAFILLNFKCFQVKAHFVRWLAVIATPSTVALSVLAIWYYAAYLKYGNAFLSVQLFDENIARLFHLKTSGTLSTTLGHEKPMFLAPILLLAAFLPWSLFVPVYLELFRRRWQNRRLVANSLYSFSLIWIFVFVVMVAVSSSKRSVYFLPCIPPMAYIFSVEVESYWTECQDKLRSIGVIGWILKTIGMGILIILPVLVAIVFSGSLGHYLLDYSSLDPKFISAVFTHKSAAVLDIIALFLVSIALWYSGRLLLKNALLPGVISIAGVILLSAVVIGRTTLPVVANLYSPKKFASDIAPIVSNQQLYQYKDHFYSAIYYVRRPIPVVSQLNMIKTPLWYLLVKEADLPEVTTCPGAEIVGVSDEKAANGDSRLVLVRISNSQSNI